MWDEEDGFYYDVLCLPDGRTERLKVRSMVGLLPLCYLRPWVGVCVFSWLAYNRTQDLTWGFARVLPISQFAVASALSSGET